MVVLVVVLVVLGVVLEQVEVVASHYCYRCKKTFPRTTPSITSVEKIFPYIFREVHFILPRDNRKS